jgi:hypothetical protein
MRPKKVEGVGGVHVSDKEKAALERLQTSLGLD